MFKRKKRPLKTMKTAKNIIKQIQQANDVQLNELIAAVVHRFTELNPGYEGIFLSLSTDPHTRDKEIENTLPLLRSCYNQPES